MHFPRNIFRLQKTTNSISILRIMLQKANKTFIHRASTYETFKVRIVFCKKHTKPSLKKMYKRDQTEERKAGVMNILRMDYSLIRQMRCTFDCGIAGIFYDYDFRSYRKVNLFMGIDRIKEPHPPLRSNILPHVTYIYVPFSNGGTNDSRGVISGSFTRM